MIVCKFEELRQYTSLLRHLDAGLACIEEQRKADLLVGRYEFEGGFLMVQRGTTKPVDPKAFETHQKYIDVQYMIHGREQALYQPVSALKSCIAYDENADIAFFQGPDTGNTVLNITDGMCYVVFPEDGHMPCRYEKEPSEYVKIVMKLPV